VLYVTYDPGRAVSRWACGECPFRALDYGAVYGGPEGIRYACTRPDLDGGDVTSGRRLPTCL
jgi:hypothetical protein